MWFGLDKEFLPKKDKGKDKKNSKAKLVTGITIVATCMWQLLLRPLLACEVELDKGSDMGSDGYVQLLQAVATTMIVRVELMSITKRISTVKTMMMKITLAGSGFYEEESEHGSSSSYRESEYDDYHTKGSGSSNGLSKEGITSGTYFIYNRTTAEIVMLESNKANLKERIEAKAKRNAILNENMISKKKALEMRCVDLLEEENRCMEAVWVYSEGEKFSMRLPLEHSIVEGFAQGGRTMVTSRVYPTKAIYCSD
ncbi:rho GTPase activation protein, Rho GTPase activating protein [Artemisia annua]|uniref:Rho GTPase activation protein, Rho GTPase activating protein n=1 Tax=Artemisia annua TaxID=35608 RepID=A0A2U1LZ15_ARTAN|nr:rho GTPase activation protein, Rho GTPase activating protein [Artemisia annua]